MRLSGGGHVEYSVLNYDESIAFFDKMFGRGVRILACSTLGLDRQTTFSEHEKIY